MSSATDANAWQWTLSASNDCRPNSLRFSPSSRKFPAHTADDLTTCTTPGRKLYPWKNVPRWSKLYDKLQQQALHAGTNSLESTSTDFERPLKDSSGLLAGQPENSPETPETPTVALKSVRHGGDDHSDDGNTLSHLRGQSRLIAVR